MPPLSQMDKHDWIVYYEKLREDMLGNPVIDSPIEFRVRWIDSKTDVLDPMGNIVAVEAMIETGRDLEIGSIIRRGRLSDTAGTGTALDDDNVMRVSTSNKVSGLDNKDYYYSFGLIKHGSRIVNP